jgi:Family of unknown function (DUF5989)
MGAIRLETGPRRWTSFLVQNKKWWLLPIMIVMVLVGTLILLSRTAVSPFICILF